MALVVALKVFHDLLAPAPEVAVAFIGCFHRGALLRVHCVPLRIAAASLALAFFLSRFARSNSSTWAVIESQNLLYACRHRGEQVTASERDAGNSFRHCLQLTVLFFMLPISTSLSQIIPEAIICDNNNPGLLLGVVLGVVLGVGTLPLAVMERIW